MYRIRSEHENLWNALRALSGASARNPVPDKTSERARPRIDLFVTSDRALLRAAVPGLAPSDVGVEVEGNLVTLTCAQAAQGEGEQPAPITRKLRLPFRADAEQAEATLRRGVLELRLQQLQADGPARITVKAD